jgi:hypothetical protein
MKYDPNQRRRNNFDKVRGTIGITMGLIYIAVAITVVYFEKNGLIQIGTAFSYMVAALMLAYGVFRIYRGYKQFKS